jgi:hypothetical protein
MRAPCTCAAGRPPCPACVAWKHQHGPSSRPPGRQPLFRTAAECESACQRAQADREAAVAAGNRAAARLARKRLTYYRRRLRRLQSR